VSCAHVFTRELPDLSLLLCFISPRTMLVIQLTLKRMS
jgi:hypothetical protein